MTSENQMYGPPWVQCALCGVVQPLASLVVFTPLRTCLPERRCLDEVKCSQGLSERLDELAAFERSHPVLHVKRGKK